MNAPSLPANYFQEQQGVLAVHAAALAMKCVWRPTPSADLGIDGQIELIGETSETAGRIVAVQIKSGRSYADKVDGPDIVYYPGDKHREYWRDFPIPVILAIHDPANGRISWIDTRSYLRSPRNAGAKAIKVPINQVLDEAARAALFETCGTFDTPLLPVNELGKRMASERTSNPSFDLTFAELFSFGMTDIGRKVFFNLDLCLQLTDAKESDPLEGEDGLNVSGPSQDDYDFLDRYVRFLISQNLVYYDFYDYLIDWNERQVVPVFLCAITPRGSAVYAQIRAAAGSSLLPHEHPVRMAFGYSHTLYDAILPLKVAEFAGIAECLRNG